MLNHVEYTIPPGTLTDDYCRDLDQFVCGILGWPAGRTLTLPNPTTGGVERARWYDITQNQFFVLHEDENCFKMGTDDHFGWNVATFAQVDEILRRCQALQKRDDRMRFLHVVDDQPSSFEQDGKKFCGFYAKYLLPVYVDINAIEQQV